jgi:hypothetical protein
MSLSTIESSIATAKSALQFGHLTRSVCEGNIWSSRSQALHLKCIMAVMKAFFVILTAVTFISLGPRLQGQSLADFARQERERQAHLKATQVITGTGTGATAAPAAQSVLANAGERKSALDPVKEYNDQVDKLRTTIRTLRDEETATQLQINELNNQVYAPVVDQAAKDQALTVVGAAQQRLMDIRKELDVATKELQALEAQGPPKPAK